MSAPSPQSGRRYTWADYRTWSDEQRWEIIGGDAYLMSPGPSSRHQIISVNLTRRMTDRFASKPCRLFAAPMDVHLSEEDVVQPDLMVVCDSTQIKPTHIEGPPALIVEIVSPSTTTRDRLLKLNLYARTGVKEYWIVTPWPSLLEVLLLEGSRYVVHSVFDKDKTLTSPSFPDLQIALPGVFDFPLEPGEEPPVVKEPPAPPYRTAGRPT